MIRSVAYACLLLLVACAAHPPAAVHTARDAHAGAPGAAHESGLAAAERGVRERLQGLGWQSLPPLAEGFFADAQGRTLPANVAPRQCVVWIAVGTRGISDLDAVLYAPSGRAVAIDREDDAHPTLAACAGDAERALYYRVSAYRGVGAYRVLRFVAPERELPELARRLHGQPAISPSADARESRSQIDEWVAGAAARGFVVRGAPRRVSVEDTPRLRVPLRVEAGTCVSVLATVHGELERVDLLLHDEADAVRARDGAPSRAASLQVCPRTDGDWSLEVVSAGGRGEVELVVMVAPQRQVGGESALWWGVRQAPPLPSPSGPVLARGRLAAGEAQRVRVAIRPGRCAIVRASGAVSLGPVELASTPADAAASTTREGLRVCRRRGDPPPRVRVSARGAGAYRLFAPSSLRDDRDVD